VTDAIGYRIYRQAPGESSLTERQDLAAITEHTDATSGDGVYTYAVASLRDANGQQSLSGLSAAVQEAADSTPPAARRTSPLFFPDRGSSGNGRLLPPRG